MIKTKTYIGSAGLTTFVDHELVNTRVITVARSGSVYSKTTGTPANMQFKFTRNQGRITFLAPFNPIAIGLGISFRNSLEKIIVKFEA